MKRFFAFIISIVLFFSVFNILANAESDDPSYFDNTQFEGLSGYQYKKIDKTYRYEAEYRKVYSDGYFSLELVAQGDKNKTGVLWMAVTLYSTKQKFEIDALDILINEDMFSYDKLNIQDEGYSTAQFGKVGIDMIYALYKAEDVAIRIHMGSRYLDLEPEIDDLNLLITWAKKIVSSGYISKMDKTNFELYDTYYAASKE